jgi:hypothetical protein
MTEQLTHPDALRSDQFVDDTGRRWPIRDQQDAMDAARIVDSLARGHKFRSRLVELSRKAGLLLPVTFAAELELDQAMSVETARSLASTETGRQALARMRLTPEEGTPVSMVTFSLPGRLAEEDRLHQRNLAMTSIGRSMLADRGMTQAEMDSL